MENIVVQQVARHREFFATHKTKNIDYRLSQLHKLKKAVADNQSKIEEALWKDLHKSPQESFLTEISIVKGEIDNHIKHLKSWAKKRKVSSPIHIKPAKSSIVYEPLGVALIIAPWNYPFNLLFNPLIGAISSGCCSVLKPSPYAPNIAKVMEEIITENFDSNYISVIQGNRDVNTLLLEQKWDIIFFTGSPKLGRVVMEAASKNLTPVVLELGGKSPCIVDSDADLDISAKRIAWGKCTNAGQTCIAPDYLFVHKSIKKDLLDKISENIKLMYGENVEQSRFFPRIINDKAMHRLANLLKQGTVYCGGEIDYEDKYIAPTIIDDVEPDFMIMQEEIFGPILPVMTFENIDEVISYINKNEKPLALYYFGSKSNAKNIINSTSSGGVTINDTLMHVANDKLPFGGVGNSGMGKYHGKESFLAFSNLRAVLDNPTWIDPPFKYAPFKYFSLIKNLLK